MLDGVFLVVSKLFVVLIFGFVVIFLIWVVWLIVEVMLFESFYNIVSVLLGMLFFILGGSFGGSFVVEVVKMFLWVCGFYGVNIVGGVMVLIWFGVMDVNWIVF